MTNICFWCKADMDAQPKGAETSVHPTWCPNYRSPTRDEYDAAVMGALVKSWKALINGAVE